MGGMAFSNTIPVTADLIPSILKSVKRKLILPIELMLLGSAGKRPVSGDIDIAVDESKFPYIEFCHTLLDAFGNDNIKLQPQFKQVYTRVTIPNTKCRKFCQVDFMFGDPRLLNFTHWSPNIATSKYSGSHRTQYIKAVTKSLSTTASRNGRVVARVGYTLFGERGLILNARWCPPRKDGSGYTMTMQQVSSEDEWIFSSEFPELLFLGEQVFTNPSVICEKIFGFGVTQACVNSYESTTDIVRKNPMLAARADLIWRLYIGQLNDMHIPKPERLI